MKRRSTKRRDRSIPRRDTTKQRYKAVISAYWKLVRKGYSEERAALHVAHRYHIALQTVRNILSSGVSTR